MIDDDVSRCGLALIDPFVYQSTTKFYNSIRADVGGKRADTDFLRTEI